MRCMHTCVEHTVTFCTTLGVLQCTSGIDLLFRRLARLDKGTCFEACNCDTYPKSKLEHNVLFKPQHRCLDVVVNSSSKVYFPPRALDT
ncbi:hypothetical protein P167DRAFT_388248 [Morchella conica CCBAS932]|uniref:Uncharacterized protein n=1 Tax=Morchella conica CCBAS932 TaxID=1392247 RepID=A0A3N4KBF2_9PEZI|nr:hypothetical protein P167DRAFT_388248 [Morchella conica CCBAS932]